ncbi:MAG: hypothetical protein ACM3WS_06425 [Bacillota bacterium]
MTVEGAYQDIASALMSVLRGEAWTKIQIDARIYENTIREVIVVWHGESADRTRYIEAPAMADKVLNASLFLRDDILQTTGERISGFVFTLQNDGKFHIDYQYDATDNA